MRASTFFCRSVWAIGMNSSLDTTWVGTGVAAAAVSAAINELRSSSLNMPMTTSGLSTESQHHLGPEFLDRLHHDTKMLPTIVSIAEGPIAPPPLFPHH